MCIHEHVFRFVGRMLRRQQLVGEEGGEGALGERVINLLWMMLAGVATMRSL